MKLIIMGGFLGAGKTSIVLQMAKYLTDRTAENPRKVVLLENEIGEVSIDDKMLKTTGFKVETLFSGCVCCTLSGELVTNVHHIMKELNPDYIIMEATGVAYPLKIKENLQHSLNIKCLICGVADAKRWNRLAGPMGIFLNEQLKDADFILINKIDAIDSETLNEVTVSVRNYNNSAKLHQISAIRGIEDSVWEELFENSLEDADAK